LCFTRASLFVLRLVILCFVYFFCCQYQCNQLPGKTRLQHDLLCDEWDIRPYPVTFSYFCSLRFVSLCLHIAHHPHALYMQYAGSTWRMLMKLDDIKF